MVQVGDLRLDPASRQAWRGGVELDLSVKEFALLELFMRRPGRALPAPTCSTARGTSRSSDARTSDVYVGYLRAKIDKPFGSDSIETVRGVGYRLPASA